MAVVVPGCTETEIKPIFALQIVHRVACAMTALDQYPLWPEGEQTISQLSCRAVSGTSGQYRGLIQIRSDYRGMVKQQAAQRTDRLLINQPITVLADADRIDDQRYLRSKTSAQICNAAHDLLTTQHPGFDRVHADVIDHAPKLSSDRLGRQRPDALYANGVLRGNGGEHRHAMHAMGEHGLQIRLNTRSAAGGGAGNGQHAGSGQAHLRDSVARMERKWSKPPGVSQTAPSTRTPI